MSDTTTMVSDSSDSPASRVCDDRNADHLPVSSPPAAFIAVLEVLKNFNPPSSSRSVAGPHRAKPRRFGARLLQLFKWAVLSLIVLLVVIMLISIISQLPTVPAVLVVLAVLAVISIGFLVTRTLRKNRKAASPSTTGADTVEIQAGAENVDSASSPDDVFLPADNVFPLESDVPEPARSPASRKRRLTIFTVSLLSVLAVALGRLPDLTMIWVTLTIIIHEAGHFAAMVLRGYSGLSMFFIPFIGGAVMGQKADKTLADELITLLAGPAPGLLAGCLIYWMNWPAPLRSVAAWLVLINILNLLPVWPLDGGRICWIMFSRHSATAQTVLSSCSAAGVVLWLLGAIESAAPAVVLFLFQLCLTPQRHSNAKASLAFAATHAVIPNELQRLSERQLWDLYQLTTDRVKISPNVHAGRIREVYNRASLLPKERPQARYLAIYVLLWIIALATAVGTGWPEDVIAAATPSS